MKIHEIDKQLVEGPLLTAAGDAFKGVIGNAKAGWSKGKGTDEQAAVAKQQIDKWFQAVGQNPAGNTSQNLMNWMKTNTGGRIKLDKPSDDMSYGAVSKYITDMVGKDLASRAFGGDAEDPAAAPAATPGAPEAAAGIGVDQIIAALPGMSLEDLLEIQKSMGAGGSFNNQLAGGKATINQPTANVPNTTNASTTAPAPAPGGAPAPAAAPTINQPVANVPSTNNMMPTNMAVPNAPAPKQKATA